MASSSHCLHTIHIEIYNLREFCKDHLLFAHGPQLTTVISINECSLHLFPTFQCLIKLAVFWIRIHYMRIRFNLRIRIQIQAKSEHIFFRVKFFYVFIKESHFLQTLLSQICFYTLDYLSRTNCQSFCFVFPLNFG
jgi:hypothetical protein